MRMGINELTTKNKFLNVGSVNNGLNQEKATMRNKEGEIVTKEKRDRVTISPQGSMMNAIQSLVKQKEGISESRGSLISRTLENGGSLKDIKEQLKQLDEQVENIDEQIAQLTSDMAKSMLEKAEEQKPSQENKTAEQVEAEKLSQLAGATEDIKNAKAVSDIKIKVEGEIGIKESEIHLGELRIELLKNKAAGGTGVNVDGMIANAEKALNVERKDVSALKSKVKEIGMNVGEHLKAANEAVEDSRTEAEGVQKPETEEEANAPETPGSPEAVQEAAAPPEEKQEVAEE